MTLTHSPPWKGTRHLTCLSLHRPSQLRTACRAWLAAIACAAVLCCGCPRTDDPIEVVVEERTEGAATSIDEIRELAKREGEVVWYTSLPEGPAEEFLKLFGKRHPDITARLVRGSTFDLVGRVNKEIEDGKLQGDLIHVLDVAVFEEFVEKGQLLYYVSSEERCIPAAYKRQGYWSALRAVGLCVAYDSARYKQDQVPHTWPDLLDPRWEGKVAYKDAQTAGSAYAQFYFLREQYGTSYWSQVAARRPRIYKTADESLDALESGEVDLVSGAMGYSIAERREKGSKVQAVWPKDGVPVMIGPIGILRGAPHRNAARLFMDFALSREGQQALRDIALVYSAREDIEPPEGQPKLSDLRVMTPVGGWEEYARRQEVLRSEYTTQLHPESE